MYKVVTNALSSQFVETNNLVCTWWFSWATHAASVFTIPAYISKVDTDTAELGYTRYGLTGCQKTNKQTNKPTLCKHMMDIRQDNAATFYHVYSEPFCQCQYHSIYPPVHICSFVKHFNSRLVRRWHAYLNSLTIPSLYKFHKPG